MSEKEGDVFKNGGVTTSGKGQKVREQGCVENVSALKGCDGLLLFVVVFVFFHKLFFLIFLKLFNI